MTMPIKRGYEFGSFRLDTANHLLLLGDEVIPLTPKLFDALLTLVESRGQVLLKDELIQKLWPDAFVEEANLTQSIYLLRKALGEGPHDQNYIVTIPKRGYRFGAEVHEIGESAEALREAAQPVRWSAISGLSVLAVLLVIMSLVIYFVIGKRSESKAGMAKSIAVLPFKPIGAGPRDEILELGMADALITHLAGLRQTVVRPISAVRKYTSLEQDPVVAGRELVVDAVLDGSIQQSGDRIRVTVRLLNVHDGTQLWADKFDERLPDIFGVQDSISEHVTQALALKLTDEDRSRLTKRYTANTEAFQHYLKGRFFWDKRTPDALQKALAYFQQAVAVDPRYALAYSGLADVYLSIPYIEDFPPNEALPKAKDAARNALALDETLAEAHAALGLAEEMYEWDWTSAGKEFRRAIELSPNYSVAHQRYANYLLVVGRHPQDLQESKKSQELEPLSLALNTFAGRFYYYARQNDRAVEECRKILEMDVNFWVAHLFLGKAFEQKHMYEESIAEFQKAGQVTSEAYASIASVFAVAGRRAEALKIIDELNLRSKQSYIPSSHFAKIYAALGEEDQAFASLERAYPEHDAWLIWLKVDPAWDSLRSDARYNDLLRRVGPPSS